MEAHVIVQKACTRCITLAGSVLLHFPSQGRATQDPLEEVRIAWHVAESQTIMLGTPWLKLG